MTAYISREEREDMRVWLDRYIRAGNTKISVNRYARLVGWLEGETFKRIAELEDVSAQAIAHSVHRDYKLIKAFAELNAKQ